MSRKSDHVQRPTEKAAAIPPSKGSHSRESKSKGSKSKGKRARSPLSGEDESQSESDPSEHAHTSKRSKGKQQQTKRTRRSSPDSAVVEIEETVVLEIEEVEFEATQGWHQGQTTTQRL